MATGGTLATLKHAIYAAIGLLVLAPTLTAQGGRPADSDPFVNEAGDTMSGSLDMAANPILLSGRSLAATPEGLSFGGLPICFWNDDHCRGPIGPQGETGPAGRDGADGATGPQGERGPEGLQGPVGQTGPQGPIGPQGEPGAMGPEGPAGRDGAEGRQGIPGETGQAGPPGPQGPPGTFTPFDCGGRGFARTASSDGSVGCGADAFTPGLAPFTRTTIDSTGRVGNHSSIVLGADGLAVVAYNDMTNGYLKVARCLDIACTTASISVVDVVGTMNNNGRGTSIVIGADGLPLLAYQSSIGGDLKIAHCLDPGCVASERTILDGLAGNSGNGVSLAIGIDGLGVMAYRDATGGDIKVAHCLSTACTSATTFVARNGPGAGFDFPTLTIGFDGMPRIAFRDDTNTGRIMRCGDVACSFVTHFVAIDSTNGVQWEQIVTGVDGAMLVAGYRGPGGQVLVVYHCFDNGCGSPGMLDASGQVGQHVSLAIGSDGLGVMAYRDATNGDLKIAHCANLQCTTGTNVAVDSTGVVGDWPALTIGSDGYPIVAYQDVTNGDLKVVHLTNRLGLPYVRGR